MAGIGEEAKVIDIVGRHNNRYNEYPKHDKQADKQYGRKGREKISVGRSECIRGGGLPVRACRVGRRAAEWASGTGKNDVLSVWRRKGLHARLGEGQGGKADEGKPGA